MKEAPEDDEHQGAMLRLPRPGSKLRYKGTSDVHPENLAARAEEKLENGAIYTLKAIRPVPDGACVTLEETGRAEYGLAAFDKLFSIAFVCTANLCRSVMAHAICVPEIEQRGWPVHVYSAGTMDFTGVAPAVPAWTTCCQNGTPPQKDGSTWVRDLPLASIDRFFVMEDEHARILTEDYDVPPSRVSLLGMFDPQSKYRQIQDPMNRGPVEFEHCYRRLQRGILSYLDTTTEIPATPNFARK